MYVIEAVLWYSYSNKHMWHVKPCDHDKDRDLRCTPPTALNSFLVYPTSPKPTLSIEVSDCFSTISTEQSLALPMAQKDVDAPFRPALLVVDMQEDFCPPVRALTAPDTGQH